mgnify:FL=1
MNQLDLFISMIMIGTALWTVMARSLLRGAFGLALTSAILSILMYRLNAPLAAAFELSVCTGLISVIFITTISLTQPLTWAEIFDHARKRLARFWFLPLLVLFTAIGLYLSGIKFSFPLPLPETENDVRIVLWYLRPLDIIGQMLDSAASCRGSCS